MRRVVVFCGSSEGYQEQYRDAAFELGMLLADKGIELVYGGAKVGLMGAVAEGVLQKGGKVIGIIPYFLKSKEVAHEGLTEMITVDTMQERKLMMNRLSDGVITLPGAWGTMEELFEMLTWSQLGLHRKPVGLLNLNGYYDALKALFTSMVQEGFLSEDVRKLLLTSDSIQDLLRQMEDYKPIYMPKILTERTI